MKEVVVVRKLKSLVVAYERESAKVRARDEVCKRRGVQHEKQYPRTAMLGKIDREYQKICDEFSLYTRFGVPFYMEDLCKHVLLVDEILSGTLFLL